MDDDGTIVQGFLCPICTEDLGGLEKLYHHVQHAHSSESNTDTSNVLKNVFNRAKNRFSEMDFTKSNSPPNVDTRGPSTSYFSSNDIPVNTPQVLGISRSHSDYFRDLTKLYTDKAEIFTNTLIIRLHKLLDETPTDEASRKEFERRTVPWAEDSDITNCRICTVKFSLTKRKHHCRLCGKIICSTCSKFLSLCSAKKLTVQPFETNLLPMDFDKQNDKNYMRICLFCKEHLTRRELKMDLNRVSSVFIDLYNSLSRLLTQVKNLAPSFRVMANSLRNGESLYTLDSALQLRKKIVYIQEEIKDLSERIEKWGLNDDPIAQRKPTPREVILQRNIRAFAVTNLADIISSMPELPRG